jgi:multidrug efflux system membrane fusion protein
VRPDPKLKEPDAPTGLESAMESDAPSSPKRLLGRLFGWGGIVLAAVMVALLLAKTHRDPSSNVATLQAPIVGVASRVGGPVKTLRVSDNMKVAAGQELFQIDPEPYLLAVQVARANVLALEGDLANARRQIEAQKRQVIASEAALQQARTRRAEAAETYERLAPLLEKRYATPEQVDTARRAVESATSGVIAAEAEVEATRLAVAEIAPLEARLAEARATLAEAELALRDCTVRAPFEGIVVGMNLAPGFFVNPGVKALMMVDTSRWHVDADFPENILETLAPGQRASVELMTAPGRRFSGTVESIGFAVTDFPELPLAQIPFIRRELDWVRLTQRFPVRVRLDTKGVAPEVLRVGATAVVTVHRDGNE